MSSTVRIRLAVATSVATLLGVPLGIWQLTSGDGDSEKAFESSVNTGDNNGCLIVNQTGDTASAVTCDGEGKSDGPNDLDDVKAFEKLREAKPWLTAPGPEGAGPWAYVVGGTGGQGLYVRDGFQQADSRLAGSPTLPDGITVYAYCAERGGWEAMAGYGGEWLRVAYPQPKDDGDTWIYSWWTVPVGHNGKIPDC